MSKRRVFPESFKREAVERVASSGLSAGAVAGELGLHETVLRRWMARWGTQVAGFTNGGEPGVKLRAKPNRPSRSKHPGHSRDPKYVWHYVRNYSAILGC